MDLISAARKDAGKGDDITSGLSSDGATYTLVRLDHNRELVKITGLSIVEELRGAFHVNFLVFAMENPPS